MDLKLTCSSMLEMATLKSYLSLRLLIIRIILDALLFIELKMSF